MKKILFTILAAAAVSAACTKFEQDTVPTYDSVAAPEVTATVVSDTEITVTITAAENSNYYGYAVMAGNPGANADKLVANGYAKDANVVTQGEEKAPQAAQIQYSEETKTVTLNLSGLTPYTEYTVYAAAVTKMGVTSEVAVKTVRTTDGTLPTPTDFDFAESDNMLTFQISFNDPVELTETGTAKAWFYAENHYDQTTGELILWKEVDIPADYIAASGKNLLIVVPASEYIPGAYVAVTYSADIVKNGAGATNAAYETHSIGYAADGSVSKKGIFGYYDYASWDISLVDPATLPDEDEGKDNLDGTEEEEEEAEPIYFSDWSTLLMTAYSTSEYPLAGKTGNGGVAVETAEANGRTVSYAATTYGLASTSVVAVKLNEAPAYGSLVSFSIEEGTFCDIFGNENNAFEAENAYYHSYGYTYDDIVGSYNCSVTSYWYGPYSETMTLVQYAPESDEDPAGNIAITEFCGVECEYPIIGTFNFDNGQLTIADSQVFALNIPDVVYDEEGKPVVDENNEYVMTSFVGMFATNSDNGDPLVLNMPNAGTLTNPSLMFGIYGLWEDETKGWYDIFKAFTAERVSEQGPAPSSKASLKVTERPVFKADTSKLERAHSRR